MSEMIPESSYNHLLDMCEQAQRQGKVQVMIRFIDELPPQWFPVGTPVKADENLLEILYDVRELRGVLAENSRRVLKGV